MAEKSRLVAPSQLALRVQVDLRALVLQASHTLGTCWQPINERVCAHQSAVEGLPDNALLVLHQAQCTIWCRTCSHEVAGRAEKACPAGSMALKSLAVPASFDDVTQRHVPCESKACRDLLCPIPGSSPAHAPVSQVWLEPAGWTLLPRMMSVQGNVGALIVIDRMLERLQLYQQYAQYWRERPQVAVAGNAAHWWRHAGSAAVQQCLQLSRRQVAPLCNCCHTKWCSAVPCAVLCCAVLWHSDSCLRCSRASRSAGAR